jgi:molybdenum cofactor biosynthesis enzyme MoaA
VQSLDTLDTVIGRAIIDHQQLNVLVALIEDAEDAVLDIATVVIRGNDDRYERLSVAHG